MKMVRQVTFSSGHRYWFSHITKNENRKLFGEWASPYNHGHNYVLDVEVSGSVDLSTGMIVNIKDIDAILKSRLVPKFANRSINDEIEHFNTIAPTVENILLFLRSELDRIGLPSQCTLTRLRLQETPTLFAELTLSANKPMITLTRIYEFAASHRLHVPELTQEENVALFGKCNNAHGHGHNYVLEVTVQGQPDSQTGMICDISQLDAIVESEILSRYDHKNLNEDLPEFKGKVTTSEVVASEIFERLAHKTPCTLYRIRLHETSRNIFEVM